MFYLIGIGLGDAKDITVKGLEIVRSAARVYLESYTSILSVGKEALEEFYGRELILADRDLIELGSDEILEGADKEDVVVLVVGDPYSATTHTDLTIRAKEKGIPHKAVHNASIMNAIGCCGLQLYSYGETVSIPFWTDTWKPDSFYDKIAANKKRGLHTLCLLDIKVKEPTDESLTRKKKEYLPPRFMSVSEAASQLLAIVSARKEASSPTEVDGETLCVAVARVGSETQRLVASPLRAMRGLDLGPPLHSLVVTGSLHPLEQEYLSSLTALA